MAYIVSANGTDVFQGMFYSFSRINALWKIVEIHEFVVMQDVCFQKKNMIEFLQIVLHYV